MTALRLPICALRLLELEEDGSKARRLRLAAPERFDALLRLSVALGVFAVADHPDGRNLLLSVGREDNAPVTVADHDLAPTGETASQRDARILPGFLDAYQLLEKEGEPAALRVPLEVDDCLMDELDTNRNLL